MIGLNTPLSTSFFKNKKSAFVIVGIGNKTLLPLQIGVINAKKKCFLHFYPIQLIYQAVIGRISFFVIFFHLNVYAFRYINCVLLTYFSLVINTIPFMMYTYHHIILFMELIGYKLIQIAINLDLTSDRYSQVISS